MTALLTLLFRRLPIGWLQLVHNRGRFAAALAGVAFANILVFMQLGFLGALIDSIAKPYASFAAPIVLSASDANTLQDGSPIPRQRMFQALATPGVAGATSLYVQKLDWKQADGTERALDVFGIDPAADAFRMPEVAAARAELALTDTALLDRKTRNVDAAVLERLARGEPYSFEVNGREITVVGTYEIGGGFAGDGSLIVSDQTFLRLFPMRHAGAPNYILVDAAPGERAASVVERLRERLPATDTAVRTVTEQARKDQSFQTTQRPVGLVFGFGIAMGALVGCIIVYQVLSTDVADHLKEYATFKAIGYPQRFFNGVVLEEAMILALFGFVPGVIAALGLYRLVSGATGLPVTMPWERPVIVLVGTLVMCTLSGILAMRRLARADPAELF